jgi:hypothetical protein
MSIHWQRRGDATEAKQSRTGPQAQAAQDRQAGGPETKTIRSIPARIATSVRAAVAARAMSNLLRREVFSEKRINFSMTASENAYFKQSCRNLLDFAQRSSPQSPSFTLCRKTKTV